MAMVLPLVLAASLRLQRSQHSGVEFLQMVWILQMLWLQFPA
jgi:hypothetical protein